MLSYARAHADELAGVLFYKVDRAARNLFDYIDLEKFESEALRNRWVAADSSAKVRERCDSEAMAVATAG